MEKIEKFNELLREYAEEYYKCTISIEKDMELDLEKTYEIKKELIKMYEEALNESKSKFE